MPISKDELFARLPPPWPEDPLPAIRDGARAGREKIVVLDDDPTGTQTLHDVPVLTEWPVETLRAELGDPGPILYLLTNSRSLPLADAQAVNREIGRNLREAARGSDRRIVLMSRSDSTLRGHFPGETDALAEATGGGVHATLVIPAFFPGGRYTAGDVHYVAEGDRLVPAGETEFARDEAFGYRASDLREWVAEKTRGSVPASAVASLDLDTIRRGGPAAVARRLGALGSGRVAVVNAVCERDLEVVARAALEVEGEGRRLLYRTAASFVPVRAGLAPRGLLAAGELPLGPGGGLILVGSHVPRSTAQLEALRRSRTAAAFELGVPALLDDRSRDAEIRAARDGAALALGRGEDAVVFTSRELRRGGDPEASLRIGRRVSESLVEIARTFPVRPRYLVAKGGITSHDIAARGLGARRVTVLGQAAAGVPVWKLGPESRFPGLVYVVFPGNVGGPGTLAELVDFLGRRGPPASPNRGGA